MTKKKPQKPREILLEEIWVSLDLLPNYEISNYGRVFSITSGRDLTPSEDKRSGHLRVALYHNGKRSDVFVARLVAECFFLHYEPGIVVEHKNGNKKDNSVLNLTLGGGCRPGKKAGE